jgi:hypothetical protein
MGTLNGNKSYIGVVLIAAVAALRYAGLLDPELTDFLLLILGGGTAAALRHGIAKAGRAHDG